LGLLNSDYYLALQQPYLPHGKLCDYDHDDEHGGDLAHHDYVDLGNLSYLSLFNQLINSKNYF